MSEESLGKCVTDQATRRITFKKNNKTGKISKVIHITHKQKCSKDRELVALEETEGKDEEISLLDDEYNNAQASQDSLQSTHDEDMEFIRESFKRYLRGILKENQKVKSMSQ